MKKRVSSKKQEDSEYKEKYNKLDRDFIPQVNCAGW